MDTSSASKTLAYMSKQLTLHEELLQDLKSQIATLKVDSQFYVKTPQEVTPGFKCKIAYDNHGLVTSGSNLSKTDIPTIDISQVDGLSDALASKAGKVDITRLTDRVDGLLPERGVPYGSGTKVTFDANGMITSVQPLSASDIPVIPMDRVENLSDALEAISSAKNSGGDSENDHSIVSPGTAAKVSYDNHGHIIKGDELTVNDLPREVINRINMIESTLTGMAMKRSVESLAEQVNELSESFEEAYRKVSTDDEVHSDRGSIGIDDVEGLRQRLNGYATYEDLTRVQDEVSTVTGLVGVKNGNASKDAFVGTWSGKITEIERDMMDVNERVDRVYDAIPVNEIMPKLTEMMTTMKSLSDRLSDIEEKLSEGGVV